MRKWVVIGVVGIAVAAVLVVILARRGSSVENLAIEYHLACYADMRSDPWNYKILKMFGRPGPSQQRRLERIDISESALIRLGHLAQGTLIVSNRPAKVISAVIDKWYRRFPSEKIWVKELSPTMKVVFEQGEVVARVRENATNNCVNVVARRRDIELWKKLVREADAVKSE